jgi:hypothetical protein
MLKLNELLCQEKTLHPRSATAASGRVTIPTEDKARAVSGEEDRRAISDMLAAGGRAPPSVSSCRAATTNGAISWITHRVLRQSTLERRPI